MDTTLLEQFLAQECTRYVRALLDEALASTSHSCRLEFDRFELTIQHDEGWVLVEDVTDATEAGAQRVALKDFAASLEKCSVK